MLLELLTFVLATLVLAVIRVAWVLSRRRGTASIRSGSRPVRVMAVLGSGPSSRAAAAYTQSYVLLQAGTQKRCLDYSGR